MKRPTVEFIKAAMRRPLDVSTVFPTSRFLARAMLNQADFTEAKNVVELGAGTGAITRHLLVRLVDPRHYLGIELDQKMVEFLRQEFPNAQFEIGLAENLVHWRQPESVDVVVSSLPWTVFSDNTQIRTVEAITKSLKQGGVFITYICANAMLLPQAKHFRQLLKECFQGGVQKVAFEWRNIPPSFVFRSVN